MIALRKALDGWLGRSEASITTPPLDGAFRPNDLLDTAPVVLETPSPDALAFTSQGILVSSGRSLLKAERGEGAPVASFDAEVSALAGLPDGSAAVGLADGRIVFVGGQRDGRSIEAHPEIKCITAMAAGRDGALFVANGSATNGPADWKRDLMEKNASGSLWRVECASSKRTRLAAQLAYPFGILEELDAIVVSESWRSALTRIPMNGAGPLHRMLEDLPAYPSRLSRGPDNSIWLAFFAPRSQLVEFVLSEPRFRQRMIAEVEADFWVAPCLRSGRSPLEPTQQGGVKQLGVLKPWSPSRSYGLVARLDATYRPTASLHSRANGRRHGVTSCLAHDGRLFFTAKGDGVVASYAYRGQQS